VTSLATFGASNDRHTKPRAIGFNHIALEVGDVDEALTFYGRIFDFQFSAMCLLGR
jgi:predicted enzyme related to lactoylglutathione lyase